MSLDYRQYISILDPLSGSSGDLTLSISTYDADPNVVFSVTTSGISSDDEIDLAFKLETALNTALTANVQTILGESHDLNYEGLPLFNGDTVIPLFKVTRSDHVVCIWSQSKYRIKTTSNSWNNHTVVDSVPVLCTLDKLSLLAEVFGIDLIDKNGDDLTTTMIVNILKAASAEIVTFTRGNNFVISTYLKEVVGEIVGAIILDKKPVTTFDIPYFRTPPSYGRLFLGTRLPGNYQMIHERGRLQFSASNSLIDMAEPFDNNNEVKMTYQAGYWNIPPIVLEKVVQLFSRALNLGSQAGNIKALQGGTGRIEYFGSDPDFIEFILGELSLAGYVL